MKGAADEIWFTKELREKKNFTDWVEKHVGGRMSEYCLRISSSFHLRKYARFISDLSGWESIAFF